MVTTEDESPMTSITYAITDKSQVAFVLKRFRTDTATDDVTEASKQRVTRLHSIFHKTDRLETK